ncbi:MAG: hypothetical protein ACFB0E_01630 [Leptolyngbyaceae cyanobacterium]
MSAQSINYILSLDGRSDAVFQNFLQANVVANPTDTIPSTNGAIIAAIESTQQQFTVRGFNANSTPFAKRLNNSNNPLWGRQRQEDVGPNPGFGTIQISNNRPKEIAFTGSTTAGIDSAIRVLGSDENLDPRALDYALMPVEEQFEDWGTWAGDINPNDGTVIPRSFTRYGTRYGHVIRQYEVVEPGLGGFGVVRMFVDSGTRFKYDFNIRVDFA